jgi:hypothetical protein
MLRWRMLGAVCAAVALAIRPPAIFGNTAELTVAAVRRGSILPLARFNGTTWINTWPGPTEQEVPVLPLERIPQAWLRGPVLANWTTWSAAGVRLGALRVTSTTAIGGGCEKLTGLAVDGSLDSEAILALAGDGALLPLAQPSPQAADPRVRRVVTDLVSARQAAIVNEAQAQRRWSPSERARFDALLARAVPTFTVLAGVRTADGGWFWFFTVDKTGDTGPPAARGLHLEGWLHEDPSGNVGTLQAEGLVIGGEIEQTTRPLGVIRLNGRDYWFLDRRQYEGEEFLTMEVTSLGPRQVAVASGGGC